MAESTVFVVDDDKGVRRSLTALGRAHGLAVEAYASSEAFLAAYDPARSGCLILDVRLAAGKSGLDLQDELRHRGHDLPIIVMTGYGNVSASVRSFRQGAVDFLEKPVVPRVLLSRIREALAADQRRQERSAVRLRLARLTSRERGGRVAREGQALEGDRRDARHQPPHCGGTSAPGAAQDGGRLHGRARHRLARPVARRGPRRTTRVVLSE